MKKPAKRKLNNRRMQLETLEGRRLFDATGLAEFQDNNDVIRPAVISSDIRVENGSLKINSILNITQQVTVSLNQERDEVIVDSTGFGQNPRQSFARAQILDIIFEGSEQDDIFINETDIDSIAFGRGGNDRLVGGSGNDDLFGGEGNDRLYGRGGVDVLMGEGGVNRLFQEDGSLETPETQPTVTPISNPIVEPVTQFTTGLLKVTEDPETRSINIPQGGELKLDLSVYDAKAVSLQESNLANVGTITHDPTNNRLVTFKPAESFSGKANLLVTHAVVETKYIPDPRAVYTKPWWPGITHKPKLIAIPQVVAKTFKIELNVIAPAVTATPKPIVIEDVVIATPRPTVAVSAEQEVTSNPVSIPFFQPTPATPTVITPAHNPLRPTLLVLTQGANSATLGGSSSGRGTFDWQINLANNLTRELEAAGSEVFTINIEWSSLANNRRGVEDAAKQINDFLAKRQTKWDVVMVGHSRGAIFNHDLTRQLGEPVNMNRLQHIMLDPTAAISMGDAYPHGVSSNVDRAVVYDDGFQFLPFGAVHDSTRVPGTEYVRVDLKGLGYYDLTSHMKVADQYASTDYAKDLAWLLKDKQASPGKFVDEFSDSPNNHSMTITAAAPNDHENIVSAGFDQNDNGNARGHLNVAGVGGVNFSVGKDGVHAGGGITYVGSGNVSISKEGVGVNASVGAGPLSVGGGVFVGTGGKSHLDVNIGPIGISLGANGGGITFAGEPVHLGEERVVQAVEDLTKDGAKIANKASEEAAKQEKAMRDAAEKAEKQAREFAEQQAKAVTAAADAAKRAAEQLKAAAEAKAKQAAEAAKKAAEATRKAAEHARAQAEATAKKVADALAAAVKIPAPNLPKIKKFW